MRAPSNNTLSNLGLVTTLNTADNSMDVSVPLGTNLTDYQWLGIYFTTGSIPPTHTLQSVVIQFARRISRPPQFTSTLYLDVSTSASTTLWSDATRGNETGQGTNQQTYNVPGSNDFVQVNYDVSSIIDTTEKLRNMEINFRTDTTSNREVHIDYVRVVVTHADVTPPASVTDLAASTQSPAGRVRLEWTSPGDNGTLHTLNGGEFKIQHATNDGVTWSTANAQVTISTTGVAPGSTRSHSLDLDANTTHFFRIWTIDSSSNVSSVSNAASRATLANVPVSPSPSTVNQTSATVSWTPLPSSPQSSSAAGYRLEASSTNFDGSGEVLFAETLSVTAAELSVSGLMRNVTYYFQAGSINVAGAVNFTNAGSTVTLPGQPGPAAAAFSEVEETALRAHWTLGDNPTGTRFEAQISDNNFLTILTSSITFSLSARFGSGGEGANLMANTTHYVRVQALNHAGAPGDFIVVGSTSTLAAPPGTASATFSQIQTSEMTVAWTSGGSPAGTDYLVEISSDGFSSVSFSQNTTEFSAVFGPAPPLLANTTHHARVQAINRNGIATAATPLGSTSTLANLPVTPLFAGVAVSSIAVSWTAPQGGAAGYRVQASSTAFNGTGVTHSSVTTNGTQTSLTVFSPALSPNTTYSFQLGSLNWNGVENASAIGSVATLANIPQAPVIEEVHTSSITVSWSLPTGGASGYRLEASAQPDFSLLVLSSATANGSLTELTVEGLVSDTEYYLRVAALNHAGAPNHAAAGSATTKVSEDFIAPDQVNDLTISTLTATSLRLNWSTPFDPTDNPLIGNYAIQHATWTGVSWSTSNAQNFLSISNEEPGTPRSHILVDLKPNTTYFVRLWTSDLKPNWSEPTETAIRATLSNAPSGLSLNSLSSTTAAFSWTPLPSSPQSDSALGYRLEASTDNFSPGTVVSSTTMNVSNASLSLSGLLSNTTYAFRVGSLNLALAPNTSSPLSTATWAATITRLVSDFVSVDISSATAHWAALPDAPDSASSRGYSLQASTTNFNGTGTIYTAANSAASASTLTVTGLPPNTLTHFRVGTLNWNGVANYVALASTFTRANAPSSATIVSIATGSAQLSWTTPAGGASGFRVEGATTSDFSGTVHSSAATNGSATSLLVSGMAPNTTYYFRAGSLNSANVITFAASEARGTLAKTPAPLSPSFLSVSSSAVTARWAALPSTPQTETSQGYRLDASTSASFTGSLVSSATTLASVSTLTLSNLSPSTLHHFRVGSLNWDGALNFTTLGSTVTLPASPGLAAVTFVEVFASSASVAWTANGNGPETMYRLEASPSDQFDSGVVPIETDALTATLPGLAPNTVLYFQVRAQNTAGQNSSYLALGSTVTRASPPAPVEPAFNPVNRSSVTFHFTSGSPANPAGTVYRVELSTSSSFEVLTTSETVNLSAGFTGLGLNTTTYARVQALNSEGASTVFSGTVSTVTLAAAPGVPAVPFSGVTNNAMTVSWASGTTTTGYNPIGTSYRVEISLASNFSSIEQAQTVTALSAGFSGLLAGTVHYARVRAVNHADVATEFSILGSTTTAPSSAPVFKAGTLEITNAEGTWIDPSLYTSTTTINARIKIQSNESPGLAVTDVPSMFSIWNFDEGTGTGVVDSSRHNRPLSLQGSPAPAWQAGHTGTALKFDGAQNYAITGNMGSWRSSAANNVWTIELWFRASSAQDAGYLIQTANSNAAGGTHDGSITWNNTTGNLMISMKRFDGNPNATFDLSADGAYDNNQWNYVTAVLNASGTHLYVNGQHKGTNPDVTSANARQYTSGSNFVWVGAGTALVSGVGNNSRFYSGLIDSVRLSTVALTAAQILENYTRSSVGIRWGAPEVDVSTQSGAAFTWTRLSSTTVSMTGANGTTTEQTMTVTGIPVRQTTAPNADTNRLTLIGSDLISGVATAQYTILVDTTPPAGGGLSSISGVSTGGFTVNGLAASDPLSGLNPAPYLFQVSESAAFGTIAADSGWTSSLTPSFASLWPNTTYHARVRSRDNAGNITTSGTSLSTVTLANAPNGLQPGAAFISSITITWTALPASPSSASAAGYVAQASSTGFAAGSLVVADTVMNPSASSLTLTGLLPNTTYSFRVGSLNHGLAPNFSSAISTSTLANAPTGVGFTSVEQTTTTVIFTEAAGGAVGYRLQAATVSDFSGSIVSSETANASATRLSLTTLNPNTTYYFRVGARNWNGRYTESNVISTSTLAGAPLNTAFANVHITSAVVSWAAPDGGAESFLVEMSEAPNFGIIVFSSAVPNPLATSVEAVGLAPNTTHYVRVGSVNGAGIVVYAAPVSTSTLANAPGSFGVVTIDQTSAAFSWSAPAGGAAGYRLESATDAGFTDIVASSTTGSVAVTQLTVSGLSANTVYHFRAAALNWQGIPTNGESLEAATLSGAPDTVAIVTMHRSSATVSWSPPAGGAVRYRLDASTASDFTGTVVSSDSMTGLETELTVTSLTANTTHHFRVAAINADDVAVYSSTLSSSTLANPPDAVLIAAVHITSVTVSWTDPPGGAKSFLLDVSTSTSFDVGVTTESIYGSAASLTAASLDPNTTYYLRAAARNWNNVLTYAATLSTVTRAGGPANFAFEAVDQSSVTTSWALPENPPAQYRLDASTASNFSGTVNTATTSDGGATSLAVSGLSTNTTYYTRLAAISWDDHETFSLPLSTSTLAAQPTNTIWAAVHRTSGTLSWTASVGGTARYRAEIATSATFIPLVDSAETADGFETELGFTGLAMNTTHFARVAALNWQNRPMWDVAAATSTLAGAVQRIQPDVIARSSAALTVRWAALPAEPQALSAEGYRLQASSTGFTDGVLLTSATENVALSTLIVSGLFPNTTYHLRVGALNWNGDATLIPLDAQSSLAGLPVAPVLNNVFVSSLTVTWGVPVGGASGYRLEASEDSEFLGDVETVTVWNGAATEISLVTLKSDTDYHVRVGALNWNSLPNYALVGSTRTDPSIDPEGPEAVDDLSAETLGPQTIRLAWSAPFDPTDNPLTGIYLIQHATWTGVSWSTMAAQVSISTSGVSPDDPQGVVIGNLWSNTTYHFRIWTQDARPNTSAVSNGASAVTLAIAPTGTFTSSVGQTDAGVIWQPTPVSPSSVTASGFILHASTDTNFNGVVLSSATTDSAASGLVVSGLDRNTTTHFRVSALNAIGQENHGSTVSTATLARAVSRLDSDFLSIQEISITARWAALPEAPMSESARGYRLEASSTNFSGGTVSSSATTSVYVSTLAVAELLPNTTFHFRVATLNWNQVPTWTTLDSTPTLANAPTQAGDTFPLVSISSLTVAWNENGNPDGTRYVIERSTWNGFTGPVSEYQTEATTFISYSLTPNTSYYFRVKALNHGGMASATLELGATATHAAPPEPAPVVFSAVTASELTVSYTSGTPANPSDTNYEIQLASASNFTNAVTNQTTSLSSLFASLNPNTTYHAQGRAVNRLGETSTFTPFGSTVTLAVPPGHAVSTFTNVGNRSFTVNWTSGTATTNFNPDATVYVAQISLIENFSVIASEAESTNLSASFSGLQFGTLYYARVRAVNAAGTPTAYTDYGSVSTTPSSEALFDASSFQITNAAGTFIDAALYTDTTTVNARVNVQSFFAPGLAVTDVPSQLALWHFDEGTGTTVFDSSLHGKTLTLHGSPAPAWSAGLTGSGVTFDGSQNFARTGNLTPWRKTSSENAWTVEMWFKTTSNSGYLFQVSNRESTSPTAFDLSVAWHNSSGRLAAGLRNTSGQQRIAEGSASYADGNWHHLAVVLDSSALRLYVDGELDGTNTDINSGSARTYTTEIYGWVGRAHLLDSNLGNGSSYTSATIDEVRISTVPFDAEQVLQSHALSSRGHLMGAPSVDVSTQSGADFSWNRISSANTTVTGSNGSTSAETITASGLQLAESAAPAAGTNRIAFFAADLSGFVTTQYFTIFVDTTPPVGAAVSDLLELSTGSMRVSLGMVSDILSGPAAAPHETQISTDQAFASVFSATGWTADDAPAFNGLDSNTTYYLRTRARDTAGNVSEWSSTAAWATLSQAVNDAHVSAVHISSVTLAWTPLPDSPPSATAEGFVLEASTSTLFDGVVYSSASADGSAGNLSISELSSKTTYHFRVGSLNWVGVANYALAGSTVTPDSIPPAPVVNLSAEPSFWGGAVELSWTAPGDDGEIGLISDGAFVIQFTTDAVFAETAAAWSPAGEQPPYVERVVISTHNVEPGMVHGARIPGLEDGATYYFRLWTQDTAGNYAGLSNGATTWATPAIVSVDLSTNVLTLGALSPGAAVVVTTSVTVTNTGNVMEAFAIAVIDPSVWTATTSAAGLNTYRLTGLFTNALPETTDFDVVDDVITTSTTTATGTVFAIPAAPQEEKGVSVQPDTSRTLWLRIEMPTVSNTADEQTIRLSAVAIKD